MKNEKPKRFWRNLSDGFFYDEPPKLSGSLGGRIVQILFIAVILWLVFERLREMVQG